MNSLLCIFELPLLVQLLCHTFDESLKWQSRYHAGRVTLVFDDLSESFLARPKFSSKRLVVTVSVSGVVSRLFTVSRPRTWASLPAYFSYLDHLNNEPNKFKLKSNKKLLGDQFQGSCCLCYWKFHIKLLDIWHQGEHFLPLVLIKHEGCNFSGLVIKVFLVGEVNGNEHQKNSLLLL